MLFFIDNYLINIVIYKNIEKLKEYFVLLLKVKSQTISIYKFLVDYNINKIIHYNFKNNK
jgi:hypothetical protein